MKAEIAQTKSQATLHQELYSMTSPSHLSDWHRFQCTSDCAEHDVKSIWLSGVEHTCQWRQQKIPELSDLIVSNNTRLSAR